MHISSSTGIDIRDIPISSEEFKRDYYHKKPLLLRGSCASWVSNPLWKSPSAMGIALDRLGDERNLVTTLHSEDGNRFIGAACTKTKGPIEGLMNDLVDPEAERVYSRAPLRAGLLDAVDWSVCSEMMGGREPITANCGVWLGFAGNITPFHYDLCHGFLVGVRGRKTFTFVNPDEWRCMDSGAMNRPELSKIDYEKWREGDVFCHSRHRKFASAVLLPIDVNEGDMLYTPPFWWHHVETSQEGPALSVLIPFDPKAGEKVHISHMM